MPTRINFVNGEILDVDEEPAEVGQMLRDDDVAEFHQDGVSVWVNAATFTWIEALVEAPDEETDEVVEMLAVEPAIERTEYRWER